MIDDRFDPEPAAEAGSAFGQLAASLPDGGLLLSSARLVEMGRRATLLLAPELLRLDVTLQEEALELHPRVLGDLRSAWRVEESTWDGYRDAEATPLELRGEIELPDGRAAVWIHVLTFTDADAGATHFIAKAELRPAVRR